MRFECLIIAPLIILSGCVQLTPHYLTSSPCEKALILYNDGMLVEAKGKLSEVKKDEPDYKAAQELLAKIERLTKKLAERHIELGDDYEKANISEMAAKEYRMALAFDPDNQLVQKRLRSVKEKKVSVQKERANSVNPNILAENHYSKGAAFLELKRFNEAIDEFTMVIKSVPSYKDTNKLLSIARKEMSEAIITHLNKGIDYFHKEEMELAIMEWDIVLDLDPFNEIAGNYRMRAEAILEKIKDMKE